MQAATPAGPISRLLPELSPMFVATSAPLGAPAHPVTEVPPTHTFGRCWVSEPSAKKVDPENTPFPVDTGYGRPDCNVPSTLNVQLFSTGPTYSLWNTLLESTMKAKFAKCRMSSCASARSALLVMNGFAGSDKPKKSSPVANVFENV